MVHKETLLLTDGRNLAVLSLSCLPQTEQKVQSIAVLSEGLWCSCQMPLRLLNICLSQNPSSVLSHAQLAKAYTACSCMCSDWTTKL